MKDTGREMQENMRVGTSFTIKQLPDVIDPKSHAQKEKEQSGFKYVPLSGQTSRRAGLQSERGRRTRAPRTPVIEREKGTEAGQETADQRHLRYLATNSYFGGKADKGGYGFL
jgi:hypothetical protein